MLVPSAGSPGIGPHVLHKASVLTQGRGRLESEMYGHPLLHRILKPAKVYMGPCLKQRKTENDFLLKLSRIVLSPEML